MILYPVTSVSNFFKDPKEVVKLSKKLTYTKDITGSWPGVRTDNVANINYNFFRKTILSVLSLYYSGSDPVEFDNTYLFFHKIKPYASSRTDRRNIGWIHQDQCSLGGIIYLNKNALPESGTSLYTQKGVIRNKKDIETKINFYKDGKINLKEYKKRQLILENKFIKTHTFQHTYNTLVAFDGDQWHACDNCCSNTKEERLSLVFFIHKIKASNTPKMRLDYLQSREVFKNKA